MFDSFDFHMTFDLYDWWKSLLIVEDLRISVVDRLERMMGMMSCMLVGWVGLVVGSRGVECVGISIFLGDCG